MIEVFQLSDLCKVNDSSQENAKSGEVSVLEEVLKYFQQQSSQPRSQVGLFVFDCYSFPLVTMILNR